MEAEELAWCAGLFEGEGCFTLFRVNGGGFLYPEAKLGMTDEDVVRRFARLVGVGTLARRLTPAMIAAQRKPMWWWRVTGGVAFEVIAEFEPWMGERRLGQIERVRVECANQPVRRKGAGRPRTPFVA